MCSGSTYTPEIVPNRWLSNHLGRYVHRGGRGIGHLPPRLRSSCDPSCDQVIVPLSQRHGFAHNLSQEKRLPETAGRAEQSLGPAPQVNRSLRPGRSRLAGWPLLASLRTPSLRSLSLALRVWSRPIPRLSRPAGPISRTTFPRALALLSRPARLVTLRFDRYCFQGFRLIDVSVRAVATEPFLLILEPLRVLLRAPSTTLRSPSSGRWATLSVAHLFFDGLLDLREDSIHMDNSLFRANATTLSRLADRHPRPATPASWCRLQRSACGSSP
jgi:hypothetical protein